MGDNDHNSNEQEYSRRHSKEVSESGRLTPSEISRMVRAFSVSRRSMNKSNGSALYASYIVDDWENKLRTALSQLDISEACDLRKNFLEDPNACIDTLADMASREFSQKRWGSFNNPTLGTSNSYFRS